jgi:hypothetical protein
VLVYKLHTPEHERGMTCSLHMGTGHDTWAGLDQRLLRESDSATHRAGRLVRAPPKYRHSDGFVNQVVWALTRTPA